VSLPQGGIFALGTASHAYFELDLRDGRAAADLVHRVASLHEPRTTLAGVNLVAGFRPELWQAIAPEHCPAGISGFNAEVVGRDGFVMPATQHDAVLWLSGGAYDVVFDTSRAAIAALLDIASVAGETASWPYRRDRDLTGFIDGSENPTLVDAAEVALVPPGEPGGGGTTLLLQKWIHDAGAWESLTVAAQERVIGRMKLDSAEIAHRAADSHVSATDQDRFGRIFRRNMPFGTVTEHGTMFVGFSADPARLAAMLASMAGVGGAPRDALTRFARPVTGAYYFVPSIDSMRSVVERYEEIRIARGMTVPS
jgi:porphyrinogen peroxidase